MSKTLTYKEKNMVEHINIKTELSRVQYIANGVTVEFETPFAVFKPEAVKIYFNDQKVPSEIYKIILNSERHAKIIFKTPPSDKTIITIMRDLMIARNSYFQEGGALRADVLNYEFNYQMACLQQLADNINRCMVIPPYAIDTKSNLTLPSPTAGKAIIWTKDGQQLENSEVEINKISQELDEKVEIATTASEIASTQAEIACTQATIAQEKADIATQKALEAIETVDNKVNVDATNLTTLGKETIIGLLMPDYSAKISLTPGLFTAEYNLLLLGFFYSTWNHTIKLSITSPINDKIEFDYQMGNQNEVRKIPFCIPVPKGYTYNLEVNSLSGFSGFQIPLLGD